MNCAASESCYKIDRSGWAEDTCTRDAAQVSITCLRSHSWKMRELLEDLYGGSSGLDSKTQLICLTLTHVWDLETHSMPCVMMSRLMKSSNDAPTFVRNVTKVQLCLCKRPSLHGADVRPPHLFPSRIRSRSWRSPAGSCTL